VLDVEGLLGSECETMECNHDFVIETDETAERACPLNAHIPRGLMH
jgi:hypothetical protein